MARQSLSQLLAQVLGNLVNELERLQVVGALDVVHALDADCQVLGHEAFLDCADAYALQSFRKSGQVQVVVELGTVKEAACPGEDRSNRVRRGFLSLLVLAIMAGDRSVSSFGFYSFAIRT